MKTFVDDVVLSAESASKLASFGWKCFHDARLEEWVFDRIIWVDPDTYGIYEWRNKKFPEVIIRIVTDSIFHLQSMDFSWRYDKSIPEESELGQLLTDYLSGLIEEVDYLSFEKDIGHMHLADFPDAYDYVSERCEATYGIDPPADVPILVAPQDMWSTWGFAKGVEALYTPTHEFVVTPDKEWKSQKWLQCLIVHEITHRIQHMKKWLIHPRDIGLTTMHIKWIGKQLTMGRSIGDVAADLHLPPNIMKRAKGLIDRQRQYWLKYWEMPIEVQAFGEQYEFLKTLGLDSKTIFDAIIQYKQEKGVISSRRDKDQLFGMIDQSADKLAKAIKELKGLVADDPDKNRTYSPTAIPSPES